MTQDPDSDHVLDAAAPTGGEVLDAATFEVLRHRLWAINDEAAVTITRVSGSPIAVEGNDFNSGLLTADGEVVVAGIYVLVHAASLGQVCRWIIENYADNPGIGPGDMFLTNDTYLGAPHQPDVMLLAPVFHEGTLVAWCGSCVHQADVGGPVPGSITVGAHSIYEEAVPLAPMRIVEGGRLRSDLEREYLIRSRRPELNRLDLLGQIAAARTQTDRLLELCRQYGPHALTGTMQRLIDGTEARLRRRLVSLPDGQWRHLGLFEHDGVEDRVYEIPLTLTKTGDHLDLDFTGASPQAPALVNCTGPITSSYAMASVMTVLGWDLPWTPAAFWRCIEVRTTPGTVIDCQWPAGMSMGVTAAGQEIRTAVNLCLDKLLDASEDPEHHAHVLASSISSSATQNIHGRHADGRPFGTMLLDGLPGGYGAHTGADGADTGGYLTSPAGLATNVETIELHHPIRYLWRRERTDSAGPGRWRGGVGMEAAYVLHGADAPIDATTFGHGQQPPTSAGALGGEPGRQNTGLYARGAATSITSANTSADLTPWVEPTPPKIVTTLGTADVYANMCAGGGGLGDPVDRPADAVAADVEDGLVSVEGALVDYAVVVRAEGRDIVLDAAATDAARDQRRRDRLGGREPRPPLSEPPAGRRLSSAVVVTAEGRQVCRRCGADLGPADTPVTEALVRHDAPVDARHPWAGLRPNHTRFVVRHWWCPGCALQVDVAVTLR